MPKPEAVEKSTAPQPLAPLLSLTPYKQGKSKVPGHDEVIKLSSNECCFGPSPAAMKAFVDSASELHRYADGSQQALREAIAAEHGLDAARIVCGNGSEELIGLFIRCYAGREHDIVLSENHFVMCSIYGTSQGANLKFAREKDFKIDIDAMLGQITENTRVLAIANPNNPTGSYVTAPDIGRLIENTPKDVLIILDGAYADYVAREDFDDGSRWVESCDNVVMTRTFSKIYGLAGLRIGWAYGPPAVIEIVNRLRTPFNASGPAMAAAVAALGDHEHVKRVREHNSNWLTRFSGEFSAMGVVMVPSVANFYLLDFSGLPGKSADDAASYLESHGIIPRPGGSDAYLRITVGNDEENLAVIDTLRNYVEQ